MAVDEPGSAGTDDPSGRHVGPIGIVLAGLGIIVIGITLLQSLIELWPSVDSATQTQPAVAHPPQIEVALVFGAIKFATSASTGLIVLAFVAGGLGALIHVATSFATYVGNGRLLWRWLFWYPARLLIGATLGGVFYFLVRGGFFSSSSLTADINPYGIGGIAALVGMLSKQATDKLTNLFESLFGLRQTPGDDARVNKA